MPLHRIIHQTYVDIEANPLVPLKTYYTQNPISEGSTFEVQHGGRTFLFRLDQHFITDEKTSLIKFLGEKDLTSPAENVTILV